MITSPKKRIRVPFPPRYSASAHRLRRYNEQIRMTKTETSWKTHLLGASRKWKPSQKWFNTGRRAEDLFMPHPAWTFAISNTPSLPHISKHTWRGSCSVSNIDDRGYRAEVTDQGAPALQMAPRFLDTMPRPLGMTGANDAVSAITQATAIASDIAPTRVDKTTTRSKTDTMGLD